MTSPSTKPRIAFWFRYGAAEHAELFHALPDIIEELSKRVDIHYFGMKGQRPVPDKILRHATLHELPFRVHRTSNRDKMFKTLLWILYLPWLARRTRRAGVEAVYIDETIPFTVCAAQRWVGPKVAVTVADFFVDIYLTPHRLLRPLGQWMRRVDLNAWRKAKLIITRARTTREYLAGQGIDPKLIEPIYDPCDEKVFYPMDKSACRREFGYGEGDIVLVHHGILHPNKGNDRILAALARVRCSHPNLKYLLVGDGPDMEHLRAMVKELRLDDAVTLTGWLPGREDVNRALNAGDIGLAMRVGHESDHFHMTGALVHAMACGLPVLAARLGGLSEAVEEGRSGYLFAPECLEEFDAKLKLLADDAALRKRMGDEAYRDAQKLFGMEVVIKRTVEVLETFAAGEQT